MMCGATYSTFLVGEAVRDRGLLTLEEAVHQLTDVPARLYGLRDRGALAVGRCADLVVFDPTTVGPRPERTRDDLPGGASRSDRRGRRHRTTSSSTASRSPDDGVPSPARRRATSACRARHRHRDGRTPDRLIPTRPSTTPTNDEHTSTPCGPTVDRPARTCPRWRPTRSRSTPRCASSARSRASTGWTDTHIISRYEDVQFALRHPEIFSSDRRRRHRSGPAAHPAADRSARARQVAPAHGSAPRAQGGRAARGRHPQAGQRAHRRLRRRAASATSTPSSRCRCPARCSCSSSACPLDGDRAVRRGGRTTSSARTSIRRRRGGPEIRHATGQEMYAYFTEVIDDRIANPGDDLITRLRPRSRSTAAP